jgi:hypothetical protein
LVKKENIMKIRKSLTALVILSASIAAPVANAQDTVLHSILSRVLSSAVQVTTDELQQQATQSVANAAHHLSIDVTEVNTRVKITDLPNDNVDVKKTSIQQHKS